MRPLNVLCIATYFKGSAFMQACQAQGAHVYLLTAEKLRDAEWPRESLDDIFYLPGDPDQWDRTHLIHSVSYLARSLRIDRIVPLDDFDLEKAALLREHLRVPGMGDTRTRYFRDKLAMRMQAQEAGIPVPDFVHVLNYDQLRDYMDRVPAPWVLKPRSSASATGIKKVHSAEQLWQILDDLGDEQSDYLLEAFVPGTIYHVDSIVIDQQVVFARAHQYTAPPMQVAHDGGIFATHTVAHGSEAEAALLEANQAVITAMGLLRGVSHTEFIQAADGTFYFLETSARVGGAHIAEMLEASSGINLWAEWARIELLGRNDAYKLPPVRNDYAGILISLAKQEYPDTSAYDDPEVVWRMRKPYHAGLIVQADTLERVTTLIDQYAQRMEHDFLAVAPLPDKPTS